MNAGRVGRWSSVACLLWWSALASAGTVNLLVNPDFKRTYAAQRLADTALPGVRAEYRMLPGYTGDAFLPYGWAIIPRQDGQGVVSRVEHEGRSVLRIQTKAGESLLLQQRLIELVPGATYGCGVWVKGSGHAVLRVWVSDPGPAETLCELPIAATEEWKLFRKSGQVGWHRHLARYELHINGPADLFIRGAELSAETREECAVTDLWAQRPARDADTLFLEDFDGAKPVIQPARGARLTEKDGGRWGRGLTTSAEGGGMTARLELGELPEQGTLEFWFKPAVLPVRREDNLREILALTAQSKKGGGCRLQFENSMSARGTMRLWFGDSKPWVQAEGPGWGWWQPGTWHHLAGSWDGEALRFYVDGVLSGITYPREMTPPQGTVMDIVLPYSGAIDEIRVSKGLRYGPIIPVGASKAPFNPPVQSQATATAVTAVTELTEAELQQERARQVVPVPPSAADYTFGIDRMHPAWEGMPGMRIIPDYFGAGADGLEVKGEGEVGRAVYVRLSDIEPGEYYVGLWTESGDAYGWHASVYRTEYSPSKLLVSAYVNGWPLRFATTAEPMQVRPDRWLTELQTAMPVALQSGDEIAFCPFGGAWSAPGQTFLRLALYRQEPARGHGITGRTFGLEGKTPQRLRLVIQAEIQGMGQDGSEHVAHIRIANPLPYAADTEVTWQLADYYGTPVAGKTELVHIEPHQIWTTSHRFLAQGDAQAYQLDVRTRPAQGFKLPVPRPTEWLELNDYTRMEFLPHQPGPLEVWKHVRKDLVDNRTGLRRGLCLDGLDWEFALLDGRRVPESVPTNLTFKPCVGGTTHRLRKDQFGVWYRARFRLPEWLRAAECALELRGGTEVTAFLNGKRIGSALPRIFGHGALGRWQTGTGEIGRALRRDGENELLICVRGGVALMATDFVDLYNAADRAVALEHQERMGEIRELEGFHDVWLRAVPAVRVRQSLVIPDVEQGQLRILTRLENEDRQPHRVSLRFEVIQRGARLNVRIPEQQLTVEAGGVRQVVVEAPAGKLEPYTPKNPVPAKLTTLVLENGQVRDRYDQRFGYRSVRVRGTSLTLNGQPVKFLGASFRGFAEVFEGEDGVDIMRTAYDGLTWRQQWDLCDEVGYLHYPGVNVAANEWSWKKLNNERYWEDARTAVVEFIWDIGSHPSIVGWEISNESYHYAPHYTGREGQEKQGERIYSVVRAAREAIWPGLWFIADGDEDLGGRLDFFSFHYLNHGARTYDFRRQPGSLQPSSEGVAHYPPDCFHLNGAAEIPRPGTRLAGMTPEWEYGSRACGDTESFLKEGNPIAAVGDAGDYGALSAACQWYTPRGVAWNKMALDGYRDMEAIVSGMYWEPVLGVFAPDVTFSMPQQAVRFYAGQRFDRRVNIHDDEYAPGRLDFHWTFADAAGKVVRGDRIRVQSDTAFLKRARIAFDLPEVKERTRFTLDMELWKDGRKRAREQRVVEVWPAFARMSRGVGRAFVSAGARADKSEDKPAVGLFDPSGTVAPVLTQLGVPFASLADVTNLTAQGGAVTALIIGPDCVTKALTGGREVVNAFVRAGGRVLVLHQQDAGLFPGDVTIEKRAWFSRGYVRVPGHPIMRGLKDMDFCMWNPDHVIARGAFRKPAKGNVLTLLDSAHWERSTRTAEWSEIIECYLGKGSLVGVQLPLVERFDTEPLAAEMFKRLLAYLEQPVYRRVERRLAVLGGATDAVVGRLNDVRAEYELRGKLDEGWPVTLLDLTSRRNVSDLSDPSDVKSYVTRGGTLWVHRARPEHRAWLEALTGRKVQIQVQPYAMWADRQALERRDGLVEGLNNLDFYWRSLVGGEGVDSLWQASFGVPKGKERGQVVYLVKVEGVSDYLFPGGLVEVPVGKGRVIIDQLKWELPQADIQGNNLSRVLSVLLTNLGIVQRPPAPKATLPSGVTYETIDLGLVVNRGLVDEKAGDGVGWADWGPEQDLRDFPTGDVKFGGVPFRVTPGASNCVVLRVSKSRIAALADFPAEVTIPVHRKNVAGLWFLHTGGWMFGASPFAWREIRYADGTRAVMALNASNTGDWNFGHDEFPDEEGTTTTVAWKGSCKLVPVTRVYQTLWVNPYPEKAIEAVVITTRDLPESECRFLAHLGVTAAILPTAAQPAKVRDEAKSQALLQQALQLLAEKRLAEARGRLEAALVADDRNAGAWKELAALRAATDRPEAFIALCRKWMEALPQSYEAHNVLAAYLEKQGRLVEALAEYEKSLELEWNQPPAATAAEALRRKLQGQ